MVGIPIDIVVCGLGSAPAVPVRMTRVEMGQPFAVVVDYAHTPNALAKVLEHLRGHFRRGRLIAVNGASGYRVRKLPGLGEVSARLADYSVFTTNSPLMTDPTVLLSQLAAGAEAVGLRDEESYTCIADRREAIRFALSMAEANDCVLLASKGTSRQ